VSATCEDAMTCHFRTDELWHMLQAMIILKMRPDWAGETNYKMVLEDYAQ
jgi:hypothetical protein